MILMIRFRKSAVVTAASACTVLAAALVSIAPSASAQVWRVTVSAGTSVGLGSSQYGSGCAYAVTVEGRPGDAAWFYDTGAFGTFSPQTVTIGSDGRASTSWTPQVSGWHRIYADSYYGAAATDSFQVGTGINLGSACVVV
ncbi:hypothetical protein [Nocardia jejuensis]|uniref:hypothetical protein n=1 Tax=Nocardia jejuensis TaxID=328049 RepID=UPI0012FB3454|nr:hypothetical protein [Nocardia jejuensis]